MWRLGDSYLSMPFYFPRKRGRGGLTSPHPPGAVLLFFVQVLFQNNLHCLGERGAAEIGSYNKITKFLKNTS